MGRMFAAIAAVVLCVLLVLSAGGMEVVRFLGALLLFVFVVGGIGLGIYALAQRASRSDVHEHTGTVRLEHSGTIRHEVAGTVQHTVQHVGTVQHVHQIDPADRVRLDALAAQREVEAEQARLAEFDLLQRKLDALELRQRAERSQVVELRRIPPAVGR